MTKNNTTALIDVSAIMNGSTVKVEKIENTLQGFPQLRMHHAVQQDLDNPNHMHLYGIQDDPIMLDEGYSMTVIAAVDSVRELRLKDDGGKYYYKVYGNMARPEAQKLLDACESDYEKKKATGRTYLLAISSGDVTTLCEFDAFGIYNDYWSMIQKAQISEKKKLTINVKDHKVNMQKSKTSNNYYHSPKKFTQYTVAPLELEELETIQEILQNSIGEINDWVTREDNTINEE